jgi:hypothetical protein
LYYGTWDESLGADFLDKFQVTISFEDQCIYTNCENGCRRLQFVSEERGKAELKEEAPIRGIRNSIIDGDRGNQVATMKGNKQEVSEFWRVISPTITTGTA